MRLTDLDAEFITHTECGWRCQGADPTGAQGVVFDEPPGNGGRIAVWFANAVGDGPAATAGIHWQRYGATLETLTLAPSIRCGAGGWHGFVRDGAIVDAE